MLLIGLTRLASTASIVLALALWKSRQGETPIVALLLGDHDSLAARIVLLTVILAAPQWFVRGVDGQPRPGLGALLRKAACYALATALLVNALRAVAYHTVFRPLPVTYTDYFATLPPMTFWLVPVGQLFSFGALAVWVAAIGRFVRGLAVARLSTFLFSFLAMLELGTLVASTWLHPLAMLLLSLGLAMSIVRRGRARQTPTPPQPSVVLGAPAIALSSLVGLTLTLAVGAEALQRWREYSQLVDVADSSQRPNVLFITLDTVRKQNLSPYGYGRDTSPNLGRLAERGAMFTSAFNPSSWTLPSHASMFTGLPVRVHQADYFRPLSTVPRTLAEELTQAGYATAGFVGNCSYCGARTGLARGFAHYDDLPLQPLVPLKSSVLLGATADVLLDWRMHDPRQTAEEVNAAFLKWLRKPRQRPFFAFLNYYDAHFPYSVPDARFDKKYCRVQDPAARRGYLQSWIRSPHDWTPSDQAEIEYAIDTYDECVAYIDYQLGKLFADLDAWGVLKNTLIVITNDHGEHFGEHGAWLHGSTLYRQLIDAPLIVVWPGHVPPGTRVDEPVSLTDLASTILDLLGIGDEAPLPGDSWANLCTGAATNRGPILDEVNVASAERQASWLSCLVTNGLQYIRSADNLEELYDHRIDPLNSQNLVGTDEGNRQLPPLRSMLDDFQKLEAAIEVRLRAQQSAQPRKRRLRPGQSA